MTTPNVKPEDIAKFSAHSYQWWDEEGPVKTLHAINPLRLQFITEQTSLANKKALDVGCGGGILSEALAKAGATVTALDLSEALIKVAKLHQFESGLNIDYRLQSVESLASELQVGFDIITCMELLEHVPEPASIVTACAQLIKPGGLVFFSTINRNVLAYLQAIVGAEYMLGLLPKGTHDYEAFIKPSELSAWCYQSGLSPMKMQGLSYNPVTKVYGLTSAVKVNYLLCAGK